MLKEMRRLKALGFAIHWVNEKSKAPVDDKWSSRPVKSVLELKAQYRPGMNMGVRLGEPSKISSFSSDDVGGFIGYLAVVDCDVKSTNKEHLSEMENKLDELFGMKLDEAPLVMSGRGNGSKHYYVVTDSPVAPKRLGQSSQKVKTHMPSAKPSKSEMETLSSGELERGIRLRAAWEISLMGTGNQVVLPPSVHPDSGRHYIWQRPLRAPDDLPLVDLADLKAVASSTKEKAVSEDFKPEEVMLDLEPISDRIREMIVTGEGCDDRSAGLFAAALAMCGAGMGDNAILSVLTDRSYYLGECAYEHAKTNSRGRAAEWVRRYTLKRAREETDAARDFEGHVEVEPLSEAEGKVQTAEILAMRPWRADLERGGKNGDGPPKTTLKNLVLILENAVAQPMVYRNLFSGRDFYGADTPWGGKTGEPLTDDDLINIKLWISRGFCFEPAQNLVLEAVMHIAHKNQRHPVRDYLAGLMWDGVPRIDTWLKTYLNAEGPEVYLRAVSRKYLLALVARVMSPGIQADSFLVLEGGEGVGKSSTGRILAGDEWFMDTLPDLKDKDAMLNLQGAWIVEISELAAFKHAQSSEAVKAFLTRRIDRVRAPYGRLYKDTPRQSMFLGTTNLDSYLRDKTGNRRFWPVKVGATKFDELKEARDQLFAEAYLEWNLFRERLDLQGQAKTEAGIETKSRLGDDDSTFLRAAWDRFMEIENDKPKDERFETDKIRLTDLFSDFGPFKDFANQGRYLHYAGEVLKDLGYEKKHTMQGNLWVKRLNEPSMNP